MYSKKVNNDKFYTKLEVAKQCLSHLNFNEYDLIIEPSAGNGSFSDNINSNNLLALDIEPESNNITKQDWLEFTLDKQYNNILVVGNPPFGIRNNLSKSFIKKAISINAKTIAFILPNVYDKYTLQSIFPKEYRLAFKERLLDKSFLIGEDEYHVPCTFYIWDKSDGIDLRFNPNDYQTNDFDFISKNIANDNDFFVMGNSPNTVKELCEIKSTNRGYYVRPKDKSKEYLIDKFKSIKFDALSCVNGGVAWRTKPEIIDSYIKNIKLDK